ncbi:MAG TPA: OB-fold nucleic acid binding domain-containing protein, partial [Bacteroidales bacterium]
MDLLELSEQEIFRRNSLDELRKLGINPYPAEGYEVNVTTQKILENYKPELNNYQEVSIAGRIMSRRIMGSASFAEIQDEKGRIQVYIKRDDLCQGEDTTLYNTVFKKLLDIG